MDQDQARLVAMELTAEDGLYVRVKRGDGVEIESQAPLDHWVTERMNQSAASAASELMVRRPVTIEESEDKPHVYPIWSDESNCRRFGSLFVADRDALALDVWALIGHLSRNSGDKSAA